jgi:Class II flagellar assembly regulator
MRIDANRPILPAAGRRDGRAGSSFATDFTSPAGGDTTVSSTGATRALSPVDGLFALQEVPEALAGHRRAIRRGSALLDRLDDLRLSLLSGQLSVSQIGELSRLVASERAQVDDPRLAAVLDEIDLRAQVELAKLTASLR